MHALNFDNHAAAVIAEVLAAVVVPDGWTGDETVPSLSGRKPAPVLWMDLARELAQAA